MSTNEFNSTPITPELVKEHGLNEEEYKLVLDIMGREPNINELGIFSVMWSEHCSYKSSKKWLKTLPTKADWVIQGPGENAGVIDIGDGQAAIFKMESHNHPSFIEPYQGAATGVGGIMRDVFTMGARPIANLNALRFGEPEHPKTRHLLSGVVEGIGGYGNCMGVPTIGGETNFHASYNGNILVNAMTVGLADVDNIFYSAAAGIGNPVVYVGSKTGRDGIHGATMASAEFDDDSDEKRPTVQVGDPFTEKLLLEACLELMATDMIVAIQDMGAAGLTSSSFEMASKGGVGVELWLDKVPMREEGMTPYELMLSESQERMLMVLKPGCEDAAKAIFDKWELDFAVIGKLTDTKRMTLMWHGEVAGDLPIDPLAEASPEYDRPWEETPKQDRIDPASLSGKISHVDALKTLMASSDLASRRWIWEQYDHLVMGNTIVRPGGDAGVVRVSGTNKGIAATTDCTPRYVMADPVEGGKQAVAEAYRNLCATGAKPLAITDNMNFGNPERPRIMGQFVGACQGIAQACITLDFPVVSGNVSLYNETNGVGIMPTPAIGGVGVISDLGHHATIAIKRDDSALIMLGAATGELGQSLYLKTIEGREEGAPPPVDLDAEKRAGTLVRELIELGLIRTCHDIADGGLLVAVSEMCLAGNIGADLHLPESGSEVAWLFGEDQGRYVIATRDPDKVLNAANSSNVAAAIIGQAGGDAISIDGKNKIGLAELRDLNEGWMQSFMADAT
ncbi:phosphoribosylformylglycinamidine synthase subunit PurL [Thalassospira alkalitolerans]|uniref:Phosphoribosylformylglycinamidine synthase subunit PurL n=1 Tax=Thalassospira alkalitolerans TaxID=1293890 RepID=A0A1Y2LF91_9PROT|nr:phosphoribosylformylglycinamidine synthase subunit PurL [Thalassospira alkalitolerans]OSQ49671.1 phosphoribosylformylglycinamidine synthase [Thalassospira alkalitolerans]